MVSPAESERRAELSRAQLSRKPRVGSSAGKYASRQANTPRAFAPAASSQDQLNLARRHISRSQVGGKSLKRKIQRIAKKTILRLLIRIILLILPWILVALLIIVVIFSALSIFF